MPATSADTFVHLPADSNQALGIAQYAIDFMAGKLGDGPADSVWKKTELFHTDSVFCGLSALALGTNAPTLLREEALSYPSAGVGGYLGRSTMHGATPFGTSQRVKAEKAVLANGSAVREWDSNGTNFGYDPTRGNTAGEFGHNDFYPVCVAAAQMLGPDAGGTGEYALRGMICLDEIRGRLAECFSLKNYKIDHVVHGAIASAATFGAMVGATAEQIESAIGMVVAHYIPWRAIRAGKQLSDSKGASAAISTEMAVLSLKRSMAGFVGPRDIFRNPEAIFRFFEPTTEGDKRWTEMAPSPFDLHLSHSGEDFAVMGMHFKLGLYEHQSAGALQGLIDLVSANPSLLEKHDGSAIDTIEIAAYEPAFGIIGNPAKMDPKTRQSADHSMAYIVSTKLRKALELAKANGSLDTSGGSHDAVWKALMLSPYDYKVDDTAIFNDLTRSLMAKINFVHGGPEFDRNYPDGIPTSIKITDDQGKTHDSGMVMYPAGHARNTSADLEGILDHKFRLLGEIAVGEDKVQGAIDKLSNLREQDANAVQSLYDIPFVDRGRFE